MQFALTPNCPAANPNDSNFDTQAIQACLDNPSLSTIVLANQSSVNSEGYIINNQLNHSDAALWIPANKTLTSTGTNLCWSGNGTGNYFEHELNCAKLIADDSLNVVLIMAKGNNTTIDRVIIDGNGDQRRANSNLSGECNGSNRPGNINMEDTDNWRIEDSVSIDAMCGSALKLKERIS